MADTHYELPELAALYDLESGWSEDRDFYLRLAGQEPRRVLEVGCGTGLVSRAMAAAGHHVTAVDPAAAMLEVGRRSPHGDRVAWHQGMAQAFSVEGIFDLAFMTGHAFQVLLDDSDIRLALSNIRRHLGPGGIFAFESRNPAQPWERLFESAETLPGESGPVDVEWRVLWRRGELIRFDTHYRFADETRVSESTLRFLPLDKLVTFLEEAGFDIRSVHGDWDGSAFDPAASQEIIVLAANPG